ncbi:putative transcription factor interactor and regulator CCHC(Zn) family [Helianthus anomalus]
MPDMVYGQASDVKVEPSKPKKIKITRPNESEIKLDKQAFNKAFVKPDVVSKQTDTLNFEKNADVDKLFQVLNNNESTISQKAYELQNQKDESQTKSTSLEFAMINDPAKFIIEFESSKQSESTTSSDSPCDSSETTNCENSELVESAKYNDESPEIAKSKRTIGESEPIAEASVESSCETLTKPTISEIETTSPIENVEECKEASSKFTDVSTSCADEVKVEGDDIVCQETVDVHLKTSNLSIHARLYVKNIVSEPALRGSSNKYVSPTPTILNENAKSDSVVKDKNSECSNYCRHGHMKQGRKLEKSANKSSNRSYNSNSSSVGSNGSGYAPCVKKQTCYNCGIPGHIARNCTHRTYVPYYIMNQRVTSRDRSYSKPMKVEKPKAKMNKHPKVKPSNGD